LPFANWIYEHLPYRTTLTRVYEAFRHYGERKGHLVVCYGLAVLTHFLLVLVAYCVGQAVGVEATGFQYLLWIPLVNAIAALPISFGNIGTAEAAYLFFFLQGDYPASYRSVVLAFALMMRVLRLFIAAIGGLVWLSERGAISRRLVEEEKAAVKDSLQRSEDARAETAGG
jgi:uncharacterized membrane protein YbhN (UPF0104 family)